MPDTSVYKGQEIGLYELINCVKGEIRRASEDAQANKDSMFSLRELELELNVGITKAGEGSFKLFVFTLGANVVKENMSRVKIVMEPQSTISALTAGTTVSNYAPGGKGILSKGDNSSSFMSTPRPIPLLPGGGSLIKNTADLDKAVEELAKMAEENGDVDFARNLRQGASHYLKDTSENKIVGSIPEEIKMELMKMNESIGDLERMMKDNPELANLIRLQRLGYLK